MSQSETAVALRDLRRPTTPRRADRVLTLIEAWKKAHAERRAAEQEYDSVVAKIPSEVRESVRHLINVDGVEFFVRHEWDLQHALKPIANLWNRYNKGPNPYQAIYDKGVAALKDLQEKRSAHPGWLAANAANGAFEAAVSHEFDAAQAIIKTGPSTWAGYEAATAWFVENDCDDYFTEDDHRAWSRTLADCAKKLRDPAHG